MREKFDFILIDTPPSMEFYTLNALTAADWVIIPSNCEFLSTQGVHQTVNFMSAIEAKTNPGIDYRILVTMYDGRDTVSKLIYAKLKKMYGDKNYRTVIGVDNKIRESPGDENARDLLLQAQPVGFAVRDPGPRNSRGPEQ